MKYVGAHVSTQGGIANAPIRAQEIGAGAFAFFTGSRSRWESRNLTEKEIGEFQLRCREAGYTPDRILPHTNYLINPGTADPEKRQLSLKSLIGEFQRCEQLGLKMLNLHPGSHVNLSTEDEALRLIADALNEAISVTKGVTAVLENVAGQGTNLGYTFEQLARIIELVEDQTRVGVCIDTCHAYSAGFDLATEEGYDATWKLFDDIIGAGRLRGMHLNDDKKPCGSRVDRHESIGRGTIGEAFFRRLMRDSRFDGIPLILETPDPAIWKEEITWLLEQEKL